MALLLGYVSKRAPEHEQGESEREKMVDETQWKYYKNKSSWKMSFNFKIAIYISDFHLNLRRMHMN